MANLTIVLWRDIPAQLLIGSGRKALKFKLPERYEKAIDRCAMKVGAKDADTYLEDWRKKTVVIKNIGPNTLEEEATKLEHYFTDSKLKFLIENNGWDI